MKRLVFSLLLIAVLAVSCWEQQWEERLERGDTGIVTHGDPVESDEKPLLCGNATMEPEKYISTSGIDGKALFMANCASCHKASSSESVGPGMQGVIDRTPGKNWIYLYVQNEDSLAKAGDIYTLHLQKQWRRSGFHQFRSLSNEEIDAILSYSDAAGNPKLNY